MGLVFGLGWIFLLAAVQAQTKPFLNISSKCLGNILRFDVGPLKGNMLDVAAVYNNSTIPLTQSLAFQCGFSLKTDDQGNAVIYASIQNCFAENKDKEFKTELELRLYGNQMGKDEVYRVTETCQYDWASREILCNPEQTEVSVKRVIADENVLPKQPFYGTKYGDARRAAEKSPSDSGFRFTTVVFFTPQGERPMKVYDALKRGYGIGHTATRLIVRSPLTAPETFTQNVAGIPMTVLKSSILFGKKWLASQIDGAAACPILRGSVSFTEKSITWILPKRIDPLLSSGQFTLLEIHLGVNGERLDAVEMATRGYSLTVNDVYIVVEIPIGAVGGYYKSHIQDNQYLTSYTIELMLELLWDEDVSEEDTRYKVLFPIMTPLLHQSPQVTDHTVPQERIFEVVVGPFASDVALVNITFPSEVLSVSECNARGFNIQEHRSQNGSSKVFTAEVPFTDRVVLQTKDMGYTVFSAHMTFGFMVFPESATFSLVTKLEARLLDIVPPSVSGVCDNENFHILVKYGNQVFQTLVGKRVLSSALAKEYHFTENGTHFSLEVPLFSPDVIFETIKETSIMSRLEIALINPQDDKHLKDFYLSCSFYTTVTECFPNGTIAALALKVESVPSLNPGQLTLNDPSCGPVFSNDQYAYFVFSGKSCGTTRKFLTDVMVYENDIHLPDKLLAQESGDEAVYNLKVSCYYDINTSSAVAFQTRPRRSEPFAETAKGQLQVEMRMALDDSFAKFYADENFPVSKELQELLYFEVELMTLTNGKVSLELENCWATPEEDRTSQPRWDLIINGCVNPLNQYQVTFHQVWADARVKYPSQVKRFQVQMFAFEDEQHHLSHQLFIHCDVTICDPRNPMGGVCYGQCSNQEKGLRRAASEEQVSSGPILRS